MGISKWIGTLLGGLWGGPWGAILGYGVGAVIDSAVKKAEPVEESLPPRRKTNGRSSRRASSAVPPPGYNGSTAGQADEFTICVCVLIAGVMKSDGVLRPEEIDLVSRRLRENYHFDSVGVQRMIGFIKELAQGDWSVEEFALRARHHLRMNARRNLLFFLLEIAFANGKYEYSEKRVIHAIATIFELREAELKAMEAGLERLGDDWAYQVLEIRRDATDAEVKKAYRRLAMIHHPDKVSGQGEVAEAAATRKFQTIHAAYDAIKKERGID
ncbi:MAG: TerB family tellurite resistance protein [Victivallales bacterium]|nr:TerB family tellurite resistance protein [Victivallales bacterium]